MDLKSLFLKAILGDDTAEALAKAIVRYPELEAVVLPRAALSWVRLASSGYNGVIPGVEGTELALSKSEKGVSGKICAHNQTFSFENQSIYYVTAATVCALGLDKHVEVPTSARISDLGKSLDLMVRARVAAELSKVEKPGGAQAPTAPTPPQPPTAVQAPAPKPTKIGAGPDIGDAAPKTMVPKKTTKKPGLNAMLPAPKKKGIRILRRHLDTVCGTCGTRQFSGEKFVGCTCFGELAKSVRVIKVADKYELQFGAGWDFDSLKLLVKGFE
jgi:hypothetical protein